MKNRLLFIMFALLGVGIISCTKSEDTSAMQKKEIQVEIADMQSLHTRALLFNDLEDIKEQGEFALNAYLTKNGGEYFTNAWVYYFIPDDGAARWRFRDVVNQDNLVNFYWPNDSNVNFVAYMPRVLGKSACDVDNISYSANSGVCFSAELPTTIDDTTPEKRKEENAKQEFVYATRLNQGRDGGAVQLRFVHPFAAIKFRLQQSHRDLTINSITLHGLKHSGTFSSTDDTYAKYDNVTNLGQDYLTSENWNVTSSNEDKLVINLNKRVPDDVNYQSQIGGPYIVIPQGLSNVKLSVNYTWNDKTVESDEFNISTSAIGTWQPGKIYTYILDLGDNKEEILFKVVVEKWDKGEDDGYENNYEVK